MKMLLIMILLLQSCGAQEPAKSKDDEDKDKINYAKDDREVVTEYRRDRNKLALVVKSTDKLPPCEHINDGQLAYVKDEDTFFNCSELTWLEIDIEGPQGPTGPQGAPADPIAPNQFYDTVSGRFWLIGGSANYATVALYTQACTGEWRLPTRAEGQAAALHGINTASASMSGPNDMWTSEVDAAYSSTRAYIIQFSPIVQDVSKLMTESHGIMCIKN